MGAVGQPTTSLSQPDPVAWVTAGSANGMASRYGAAKRPALARAVRSKRRPTATQSRTRSGTRGKKKKWNGASSAPARPDSDDQPRAVHEALGAAAGRGQAHRHQQDRAHHQRQTGGRGPVDEEPGGHDRRDGELGEPGQPLVVVRVDHQQVQQRSLPGRQVAHQAYPSQAAAQDHEDRRQERGAMGRPLADEDQGQAVDHQRERSGQRRGLDDEDRDREQVGRASQEGGVEVGEPVVDERLAGEERDLRREVARVDRLGNGHVDAQVAPVRAGHEHGARVGLPQAAGKDCAHPEGCAQPERESTAVAAQGATSGARRHPRTSPAGRWPFARPRWAGAGRGWRRR